MPQVLVEKYVTHPSVPNWWPARYLGGMALAPLSGHRDARLRLARAAAQGQLPQALLFNGPVGIGRQRLALWLAQLLLCEKPADEPCGVCGPCRKVLDLAHPDVHWIVPIPRPKAAEPAKQVEEAAESMAAVMNERRESPLYQALDGMAIHGIASVRLVVISNPSALDEAAWTGERTLVLAYRVGHTLVW